MKQRFKTGVGAFVLCVVLLLAGTLPVCAVEGHPVPDSGMTLDTSVQVASSFSKPNSSLP